MKFILFISLPFIILKYIPFIHGHILTNSHTLIYIYIYIHDLYVMAGVATGAVTQAAVGVALNTSINVSDRPVTGQGVTGMKGGGAMQPGRLVEDGK